MRQALGRDCFVLLILAGVCAIFPLQASAQSAPPAAPYGLKVTNRPGLLIVLFQTQQGSVRAYLPDTLLPGEPFSGTVEAPPQGASSAPSGYFLQLDDQQVMVKDRTFHWTAPADAGTIPLRLKDFQGTELGHFDLLVNLAPRQPARIPEQFRVPDLVQSKNPIPILGPFDGNSASTSVELGGVTAEVLTEVPGKAMVLCSADLTGPVLYEITKSARKSEAETRVLSVRLGQVPESLKNGKRYKFQLSVSGLAGIRQNTEIKLEIVTPTLVSIAQDPPISYFPHDLEYFFIHPDEVRKDGTYVTQRALQGIQQGAIEILANVVMPLTPHEVVEQILRTPRVNFSKTPAQEHAEALKSLGEDRLPLLAEFLTGDLDLSYEALQTMLLDPDRAAPLVIAAIPKMSQQPLEIALGAYARSAHDNPAFLYRRELHDAALGVLERGASTAAVNALGVVGGESDFPILEQIYRSQSDERSGNALIRDASEAALARLGSQTHIANIKAQLSVVVKNTGDAAIFERGVRSAVFTDNKDFIPLLCAHLHDPSWSFGDYGISPAGTAEMAIFALLHKPFNAEGAEADCQAQPAR
ncbi:MAG: hypothetical protein WAK89_15125 [Candidatus Sulfotelmatobacter sp.]